jgi:hypothetical protein
MQKCWRSVGTLLIRVHRSRLLPARAPWLLRLCSHAHAHQTHSSPAMASEPIAAVTAAIDAAGQVAASVVADATKQKPKKDKASASGNNALEVGCIALVTGLDRAIDRILVVYSCRRHPRSSTTASRCLIVSRPSTMNGSNVRSYSICLYTPPNWLFV